MTLAYGEKFVYASLVPSTARSAATDISDLRGHSCGVFIGARGELAK
jgi:hypothetical protein